MAIEIINTWQSKPEGVVLLNNTGHLTVAMCSGDYILYRKCADHYIYTWNGFAFSELAHLNRQHFESVVNRTPPTETQALFLYNRAIATLEKAMELKQSLFNPLIDAA